MIICGYCGVEIQPSKYREVKFCSRVCSNRASRFSPARHRRIPQGLCLDCKKPIHKGQKRCGICYRKESKHISVVCSQCGKSFERLRKQAKCAIKIGNKKSFCSSECNNLAKIKRVEVNCRVCDKVISRTPSQLNGHIEENSFCSKSCANKFNNPVRSGENHPGYVNGISSYRERAFQKYGRVCTVLDCGYAIEKVLEVHHRDGNRQNNGDENLDVLCPTHHDEFEHGVRSY